jgi:hypothetical protein
MNEYNFQNWRRCHRCQIRSGERGVRATRLTQKMSRCSGNDEQPCDEPDNLEEYDASLFLIHDSRQEFMASCSDVELRDQDYERGSCCETSRAKSVGPLGTRFRQL